MHISDQLASHKSADLDLHCFQMGIDARKPVFGGLRTLKAQTNLRIRSLISIFVIRFFESIISRLAAKKISIF